MEKGLFTKFVFKVLIMVYFAIVILHQISSPTTAYFSKTIKYEDTILANENFGGSAETVNDVSKDEGKSNTGPQDGINKELTENNRMADRKEMDDGPVKHEDEGNFIDNTLDQSGEQDESRVDEITAYELNESLIQQKHEIVTGNGTE